MATHIRANMHTSLAAWQARLKDKERRAVTRHKRLPRSRKGTGGTGGGGVVFAHRMGENHIIIIFIQFHHFVRPTVSVRAVVSQPNEQRHSFSIYIWGSVTIKGNRPHFLPASQLARHTHTHTHSHSIDGVWGYACPSDLSLFNKIRLLGVLCGRMTDSKMFAWNMRDHSFWKDNHSVEVRIL